MQPPVFYAAPEQISPNTIILGKEESNHAARVMRMTVGDLVIIVDGLGNAFRGEIVKCTGRSAVEVACHSEIRNWGEPAVRLTLAAGLSSAEKFDSVIQKGTELGVKRFVPLVTEKSKVKLDDTQRARRRVQRLEKVALASIKQCRRSYRPEIAIPERLSTFLKRTDPETINLIFHPGTGAISFDQLQWDQTPKRVTVLVGPEAGFSDDELYQATEAGYRSITLGQRILRAETAGPVICGMIMNALGELR